MTPLADAALRYAARGWQVFPCHTPIPDGGCSCGNAECESQGKHPRVAWKSSATTDPQTITSWWKRWPDANIGIATGARSGLVVLDIDGEDGAQSLELHGGTKPGPQATTGRGEHRYLAHPGRQVKNFIKRDGLDLRGDGGYVIAPPSLHRSGTRYDWLPDTGALAPASMPYWLLDMLTVPEPAVSVVSVAAPLTSSARILAYASVALGNELVKLLQCGNGARNKQLNESALKLGHIVGAGWLNASSVEDALLTTAMAIGLPRHEAIATIASGITAGRAEPTVLTDRPLEHDPKHGLIIGKKTTEPLKDWFAHGVNAFDLQGREFAHVNWPVANILSEGCTLLAGKPKSKKSWLALSIAVDVALGRVSLGGLETKQSRVIYLDLESNQRRMQSRLRALLGSIPWPDNLHIFTEWPRGEPGILQLDDFRQRYKDTGLVIVDILQNIRPARIKNANPYDEDYEAVKPLTAWGEHNHAGVLVLHHTRKAKADDVFDEISGSTGLSAGVSAMWVLGRMPNGPESVLAIRGRDIVIDDDMALAWDDYSCRFTWTGSAEERSISQERRAILDAMSDSGEYAPKELAAILGKPVNSVIKLLIHLFNDRLLEKTGRGQYVKVMGRQTYGLVIHAGTTGTVGTAGTTGTTGTIETRVASAPINFPTIVPDSSPLCPPDLASGHNGTGHQEASNTSPDAIVPVVPTSLGVASDYDHDKQREQEAIAAIGKHDFKAARRAAAWIHSRKSLERVEKSIDEAEHEFLNRKESR